MVNVFIKSTGNSMGHSNDVDIIRESYEVIIDYQKTLKDLAKYEELRDELTAVIQKHIQQSAEPTEETPAIDGFFD